MKKCKVCIVIFWGALWGLTEATLGYVLHSLSFGVGWLLWFPLACYFMEKAYRKTGTAYAVPAISIVAASIKCVDLLLPVRIDRVINPAVSILLEGLVLFAAFKIMEKKKSFSAPDYLKAFAVSIGWRALYSVYILCMPPFFFQLSPLRATVPLLQFLFLESLLNSAFIIAYIRIKEKVENSMTHNRANENKNHLTNKGAVWLDANGVIKMIFSLTVFLFALFVQWIL